MGFFSDLLGLTPKSAQGSFADIVRDMSPGQKEQLVHQANLVFETMLDYQERDGAAAILGRTTCVYVHEGNEIGSCGIVGNPALVRKLPQPKISGLVYLSNLKSFANLELDPTNEQALRAVAIEATMYLMSGQIDPPK